MIITLLIAAATANCIDLPNQPAMNQCQQAAEQRADARLNQTWRGARAVMDKADREGRDGARLGGPGYAAALLSSQRAWLAFRNAECVAESYEWRGGTMQPFVESRCRTQLTDARTRQLKELSTSIGR